MDSHTWGQRQDNPAGLDSSRPSTPIPDSISANPSRFYAKPDRSKEPPPLPSRPKPHVGSSHTRTAFVPSSEGNDEAASTAGQPPGYYGAMERTAMDMAMAESTSGFREPELIANPEDEIPRLTTPDPYPIPIPTGGWGTHQDATNRWGLDDWNATNASMWTDTWQSGTQWQSTTVTSQFNIDGRDLEEELNWWDHQALHRRPGPGILPPILANLIHDSDHTLYYVTVTAPPEVKPPEPPAVAAPASASSQGPSSPLHGAPSETSTSTTSSSTAAAQHSSPTHIPPTADELHHAIPHPNAYYCKKDNGWAIVVWRSSSVAPPLSKTFQSSPDSAPLPDQARRKKTQSCIADEPYEPTNHTHHFHKYEKGLDSHQLTPAYRRPSWQRRDRASRMNMTPPAGPSSPASISGVLNAKDKDVGMEGIESDEEGELMDLYVCCQCSFYCAVSGTIPGVVPAADMNALVRDKMENPPPGKTGALAVLTAFETILQILYNRLWVGNVRLLRITRNKFVSSLGTGPLIHGIFHTLGFTIEKDGDEPMLRPPLTDPISRKGKENRAKLLRAWVELNAWLSEHVRQYGKMFGTHVPKPVYVKTSAEREHYQSAIGAHPKQIPRGNLHDGLDHIDVIHWERLGLTPSTYSTELLAFGYLAQCRCHPAGTVEYFSSLVYLASEMQATCPQEIQTLVMEERERGRFTTDDLNQAIRTLGFGHDEPLRVEYDHEIEEEFIQSAWQDRIRRAWRESNSDVMQKDTHEALRMIAEARGSAALREMWKQNSHKVMNPDKAYEALEVPKDVDEGMLILVYEMRVQESPLQRERWSEALNVIAESRDSDRLRQLASTGKDPGDMTLIIRKDLPRGLNQLGNTCYLNSLLQYFYTIKDLREAVIELNNMDVKDLDDEKLTDDDIKRHRVGGRLVTRREIIRSRKFVSQLAELFFRLEHSDDSAVTPSLDLAKLALVTSRDEEEDEADKGGTDSSNDTDATLVDDGPSSSSRFMSTAVTEQQQQMRTTSPTGSPGSVLGKRPRDGHISEDASMMNLDIDLNAGPSTSSPPVSPPMLVPATTSPSKSSGGDVEMQDMSTNSAPLSAPMLTRKPTADAGVMMFGRQHDVAECMDNCMFQIETALLKFDDSADGFQSNPEKTSIVKRLFYGKLRQRITALEPSSIIVENSDEKLDFAGSSSGVHEKEDLFSHLPVNVTEDGYDIYDGLAGYFDDTVDFDKKKMRMEMSLVELPPLLQIQLQRVQFNRETLQPYKSQAYVKFGETIYMDRFLDGVSVEKKNQSKSIQAELSSCRERLNLLSKGKSTPFATALANTCDFLAKLDETLPDVDDELVAELSSEKQLVEQEIAELRARASSLKGDLEALWQEDVQAAYELTSVFVHRGSSPSWGHYFFYSRHLPDRPDEWFKYNDSEVTVTSKEEVLADTTGSTANPYLLVFARKGLGVVDTVKRYTDVPMLEVNWEDESLHTML